MVDGMVLFFTSLRDLDTSVIENFTFLRYKKR